MGWNWRIVMAMPSFFAFQEVSMTGHHLTFQPLLYVNMSNSRCNVSLRVGVLDITRAWSRLLLLYVHDFALSYEHCVCLWGIGKSCLKGFVVKDVMLNHHQSQCHPLTVIHYRKSNGPKVSPWAVWKLTQQQSLLWTSIATVQLFQLEYIAKGNRSLV